MDAEKVIYLALCLIFMSTYAVAEPMCSHVTCFGNPENKTSSVCTCYNNCTQDGETLDKKGIDCILKDDQYLGSLLDSVPQVDAINLTCDESAAVQVLNESTISKHNSTLKSFISNGCKFQVIDENTFTAFAVLSEIVITDGNVTNDSIKAFSSITPLISLNLDFNHFFQLNDYSFCEENNTCALEILSLRSSFIQSLSNLTFEGLSSLQTLELSGNQLETVPIDNWSHLRSLRNVNLANNIINYLPRITPVYWIERFDVSCNNLTRYNLKMGLGTLNYLQYLNVSHNEISVIKAGDFVLYNVRVADLSFNKIEFIEEDGFDDVGGLKLLDLRYNRLKTIPDDYSEIEYLLFYSSEVFGVYFYGNPLECGCDRVKRLKIGNGTQTEHLKVLDYNQLVCYGPYSSAGQLVSEVSFKNVLCPLDWKSDAYNCSTYYRMSDKYVIANCSYSYLPNALVANINILDFTASLRISSVYYLVSHCIRLDHLYELYLSDNQLWDMQNDSFIGITSLKILHLDRNNFTNLTNELEPLTGLEKIYLENNSLNNIDINAFVNNTNLTHIYLHNNEIEILPEGIFDQLNELESVTLHGNPYSCECGNRWLKFWLKEHIDVVQRPNDIICSTESRSAPILTLKDDEFGCKDDEISDTDGKLTFIIVASCVCGIFLISSLIVFKFRRALRVILYARFGIDILHNDIDETGDDKTYDAFISYCNEDFPIVINTIIPRLEGRDHPYKLCIRDRDFPVGDCIATAIIDTVKVSQRTIILLSRKFLASEWSIMEFKAAHHYALRHQQDHLIVVLLEKIPIEDIVNEDIRFYLSSNTYVEWNDPLFWDKLYFALPKKTVGRENEALRNDEDGKDGPQGELVLGAI